MYSTCIFNQNKHSYTCVEVIFNWQTNVTWSYMPASIFGLFCFLEGLDWGTIINFKKKRQERNSRTEGNEAVFCMLSAKFHKGFTFTTTRCTLQLTQHILTFYVRRSLKTTNLIVCGCRFANDFFCKIIACGSLIYWWYYWKMFTVNFYASCFVSRGTLIGKKTYNTWLGKGCFPAAIYAS